MDTFEAFGNFWFVLFLNMIPHKIHGTGLAFKRYHMEKRDGLDWPNVPRSLLDIDTYYSSRGHLPRINSVLGTTGGIDIQRIVKQNSRGLLARGV
jgi:hypothetical protein